MISQKNAVANFSVSPSDVIQDMIFFANDCYNCKITKSDDGLSLIFENGQIFKLTVEKLR